MNSNNAEFKPELFQRQILIDIVKNFTREKIYQLEIDDLAHNFWTDWKYKETFDKNFVVLSYRTKFAELKSMFSEPKKIKTLEYEPQPKLTRLENHARSQSTFLCVTGKLEEIGRNWKK